MLRIALSLTAAVISLYTLGAEMSITVTDHNDRSFPPALGNGHTGLVMSADGFSPNAMYIASAFNDGVHHNVSHLQQAIIPISLTLSQPATLNRAQTLDMGRACVSTTAGSRDFEATCTMRALRQMPHAVMAELDIRALRDIKGLTVSDVVKFPKSLSDTLCRDVSVHTAAGTYRFIQASATYNHGRDHMVSTIAMIPGNGCTALSADSVEINLSRGATASITVIAATCTTADFTDPWNESERQAIYALRQGRQQLTDDHESQWRQLWRSNITIEGDDALESHIRSALYNIYSSIREGSRQSIAPMGLTSGKYYGHIFWDADTWILPVLAVLHPELARSMVDYRYDNLPAARRRAGAHGYRGAMFPWESDNNGEESTPTFALTGPLEHHITADVARGAWLYYCTTADIDWLRNEGYPLIRECADFWVSRAHRNTDGTYSIDNVVGADEYAIGVNDNAFTNGAAIRNLQYAVAAADILGLTPDTDWLRIANRLKFHFMPGNKVIKEHATYNGARTKQADVELLAYPLYIIEDPETIKANIDYYSAKIDSIGGPAMSHSAMAVNYSRLGDGEQAARLIDRAYKPNLRGGFHALSESPGNDHTYFMTGAGGLLQAIIFGYAGIDITSEGVRQIPSSLPSTVEKVTVTTPHGTFIRSH